MVFQSFEVQAYDYLVKPVDEKQFEKTMERLYASMQNASEDSLLVQKGILVGNKLGIAKSMGIEVDCSLFLPYPCSLKDIDICIVLSNALDNAIHAVKSLDAGMEKYIRVSGRIQGDFLMMEIENSFHGNSTFKKGTGLSNINAVAEKYGGAMSIEIQENVCILHVLLIIPPHPESSPQQMD